MKKSLLFSAAALLLAGAMSAQTFTAETVWSYDVKDGVANKVPGLDAGWSGFNANKLEPATATCSRFGVGRDGKMLTTDHIKNAIIAIDKDGVTTFKQLPARTAERWNGTAVTTDDAGNVIINYNFTDAKGSAQEWAVITKDGNLYNLTCASSLANQGGTGRVDIMGHIVGDVTSTEGGIGYVTTANAGAVIKMMFKGNGTIPTELNCIKAYESPLGALTLMKGAAQLASACPRFTTVAEINAYEAPAFILPLGLQGNGVDGCPSSEEGWVGKFIPGWSPASPAMGNRNYMGIAYFELGGKSYIVRNYITDEFAAKFPNEDAPEEGTAFNRYHATMNFAVYEYDAAANTAKIAATWQESEYSNAYGEGTLTAEVVDDKTVNIYTFAATGSVGDLNKHSSTITITEPGVYCAMVKLTLAEEAKPELQGAGTEADPYLIGTPDDLCAAHLYITQGEAADFVYFKQTADIDMAEADYDKWEALNGWGGEYNGKFVYDGDNHLIKNFAPGADRAPVDKVGGYYDGSIFGVLRGTVKNLGIIDADTKSDGGFDGAGIISDYSGQGGVDAEITNVFVTGKVAGNKRIGGMLAHAGGTNTLTDVYAVVELTPDGCNAGGIIGNLNGKTMEIDGGYVSAVINNGNATSGLIAGGAGTLTVNDFIVIGEGAAFGGGEVTVAQYATLTAEAKTAITELAAFDEGKMLNGMPTFDWVNLGGGADEPNIKGSGTAADPYLIATAADLCEAHNLIPQGEAADYIYFKQTADIDMKNADYDKWEALNGWGGEYNGKFVYDGDYHVIRNFNPGADREPVDKVGGYYDGSIFGVLRGTVKNLGVINANTKSDGGFDGAGIISDYSGQGGVDAEITNVFVTGKVAGNKRIGGMLAHAGGANTLTDVYAVVELTPDGCNAGGIIGNLNTKTMEIDGGYVSATINNGNATSGLIAGGAGTLKVDNFVTIGAGAAYPSGMNVTINDVVSPKFDSYTSAAANSIMDMDAFNDGKELNGMPTFNWMTDDQISGVDNVVVDGADEAAPAVYYNLQGVRVENPANGLYIKKQGNKVSKVVIR